MFIGTHSLKKMQWQNNTDNQIIINEGNKCLPPSVKTLPPRRGGKNLGEGLEILCPPPWQKPIVHPCIQRLQLNIYRTAAE